MTSSHHLRAAIQQLAMDLNPIGPNQTEIVYDNGNRVFFSYKTPVAVLILPDTLYVTTERFSNTTSKHINGYIRTLHSPKIEKVDQATIKDMASKAAHMDNPLDAE